MLAGRHGPCPGCGGKDRFRFDDREGGGTFICSQGGRGNLAGDGFELLKHITGKSFPQVLEMVGEIVLGPGHRRSEGWSDVEPGVAAAPRVREGWIPPYDRARLIQAVASVPDEAGEAAWFECRSPVDPRGMEAAAFLDHVFRPGERVLIFTRFKGPGDFLWQAGSGGCRLGAVKGVKAVPSALPRSGGKDGVWYLCNPVSGRWCPNPRQGGKLSRRSQESVTSYRHLVLENDTAKDLWASAKSARAEGRNADAAALEDRARSEERLWKRFLAMVPLPIVAIYSSGGASWHALVRVDMPDKPSFDSYLRGGEGIGPGAKRVLPIFGADPNAMSAVRLTRLPGCTRGGRLQRLIFLRPAPNMSPVEPIITLNPLRFTQ